MINYEEMSALKGLPHLQQLLYLCGIKPFMDYRTGIAGIMRGISYQSLAEELYVEPHSGIKSGSPSKDQIRRAIKGLESRGLLRIQSMDWKLVFLCLLATSDTSNLNKPAIKRNEHLATTNQSTSPLKQRIVGDSLIKQASGENDQPAIPPNNNYFIFLYQKFEQFWENYPLKKSREKTWEQFQSLQPTEELVGCMLTALDKQIIAHNHQLAHGQWVPGWKFPANWLAQHCWNDEINMDTTKENTDANHKKRDSTARTVDPFWDSCKDGAEYDMSDSEHTEDTNIINISGYRKT
jgi:hypothetical protein